jgi:hypothetical protein
LPLPRLFVWFFFLFSLFFGLLSPMRFLLTLGSRHFCIPLPEAGMGIDLPGQGFRRLRLKGFDLPDR